MTTHLYVVTLCQQTNTYNLLLQQRKKKQNIENKEH